mgnify:CR=1 FL=1
MNKGYLDFKVLSIKLRLKVSVDKFIDKKLKLKDLENQNFISLKIV